MKFRSSVASSGHLARGNYQHRWPLAARLVLLAVVLGAVAGCGSTRPEGSPTTVVPYTDLEKAEYQAAQDARYRLRVGDQFKIDFKFEDQLDQQHIVVLPDGRFSMAGLEDMKAAGLTLVELDSAVTDHFGLDYRHPELSVIMEKLAVYQVYVLGEVRHPGLVDMPTTGRGVLQAVATAGGFNDDASPGETVLIRATPEGYMFRRINLSHLEKNKTLRLDMQDLQPFDVIYVPRSAIGDLAYFTDTVLKTALTVSSIFWDVYAIQNLNLVRSINR